MKRLKLKPARAKTGACSPFYTEGKKMFMRFDRIDVERGRLVFYWRGKEIISKPLEDGMSANLCDTITIAGIEGRSELAIRAD